MSEEDEIERHAENLISQQVCLEYEMAIQI